MKILIIKTFPEEIRTEKITYNVQEIGLAKALIKKGHQCDIMCCADKKESIKEINVDGKIIKLYAVDSFKIMKNGIPKKVDSIIRQYDIIQTSEYNQMFTWHLAKKYKEKTVVYHGPYYSSFNKKYNLMSKVFDMFFLRRYKKYNTTFMTKSSLATDYLKNKGLKNVNTIGVGIDKQLLESNENVRCDFYDELNDFKVKYKLLYIGRIEPRRNTLFVIDILKSLIDKGIDVGLVIIGKGEEYKEKVFDKISGYELESKVLYKEALEQKYLSNVYNYCDIFLLPTFYEIFGMVLLEAMYFGLPVITTPNGGSVTLINNSKNGFIIELNKIEEWNKAIIQVLDDVKYKNELSQNAKKTVESRFTWDILSDEFLKIYNNKINNKKK